MSSAGHVIDMINRAKYNRSILKKRKKYCEIRDFYQKEIKRLQVSDELTNKEYSEEAKQKIRKLLIKNHRIKRRNQFVVLSISVAITILIMYYLKIVILKH